IGSPFLKSPPAAAHCRFCRALNNTITIAARKSRENFLISPLPSFAASLGMIPGGMLARGLYTVGRSTFAAYRAGGAYHAANVATMEGAALAESTILTGVGVSTGAEVPSVLAAPATAGRRLAQSLDAG